jgi:VIT1/CCC1 family predicted Fe2+/Mn2+ transporter
MSNNPDTRETTGPRSRTYVAYSIGVALSWGAVLILRAIFGSDSKKRNTLLVFAGFAIGWTSATIARYVYPPPKKYRRPVEPS